MSSARRGSVIGATWLIGLGLVFLVRGATDWSWGQAWPLFVILVGVASFVSTALTWRPSLSGLWSFTWPLVWIAVGVILLMSTTGNLDQGPGDLIAEYWPWLAVGLGVWFLVGAIVPGGPGLSETLVLPLGGAPDADVRIKFGAGELATRPAAAGNLVDGEFLGGVRDHPSGPNRVELEQDLTYGLPWLDRESRWTVGLTAEVPLDLKIETGASRARLDLVDLRVRNLELNAGAADTRVRLPRAAGATSVRAQSGAATMTLEVPPGVAARIKLQMALGSSQVDESRFPRTATGYESPDYATAANRVDIDIQGGVGSVKVIGGA
ncbi:MAG TPA: hypothetical protein VIB02_00855 [Candidatus Limnocylindrales bacterium]